MRHLRYLLHRCCMGSQYVVEIVQRDGLTVDLNPLSEAGHMGTVCFGSHN